ncbi:MAG: 30S ribosomal protein S1 [FCB group bacterium]|nr:30S ribosomal protein S1 [FCB group bacterium]
MTEKEMNKEEGTEEPAAKKENIEPEPPEETTESAVEQKPEEVSEPPALTEIKDDFPPEKKPETPKSHPAVTKKDETDRVIKVDSLDEDPRYAPEEFERMLKLYESSLTEIQEGNLVKGRIVAISDKDVAIDIGFKAEGTIPIDEFDDIDKIKIGEEIDVFLDKVENQEGQLVLSKRKADFMHTWDRVMRAYQKMEIINGTITRRIKGGMVVDILGIDAFLPGSQIDIHPIRDFDALVGEEMDFRIVKVNELRKNIVLSHKVLLEESLSEVREKKLNEMYIGQVVEGMVKNITDFGVFVDLGGVDGLLHITDLSWGRINHPSEVVGLDDKILVKIIDYDLLRKRISIGYKQLQPHPWEGVEERYPIGAKVTGKIVSITNYGAFVELERGVEGLIHISEMSWTQHIKHPSSMLSIGDEVEAIILSLDVQERKISLGLKQTEPDPWETLEEKYLVDSKHTGIVRDLMPFGAFVELEDGIEGLVHISDLSWTKKVRHPGEVVKKGDEIEVIILGFDRNERRIALGLKQTLDSPWDGFEVKYAADTSTSGKIVRMIDKGVIVELPLSVEGFVPNSQLGRDEEGPVRKRLKPGDELELVVVEFDKEAKRIVLSATEARRKAKQAEYAEYVSSDTPDEKPKPKKKEKTAAKTPGESEKVKEAEKTPEKAAKTKKEKKASEEKSTPSESKIPEPADEETPVVEKAEEKAEADSPEKIQKTAVSVEQTSEVQPPAESEEQSAEVQPPAEPPDTAVMEELSTAVQPPVESPDTAVSEKKTTDVQLPAEKVEETVIKDTKKKEPEESAEVEEPSAETAEQSEDKVEQSAGGEETGSDDKTA